MLDFSSALYLGMRHPSGALAGWDALTLGRPAALAEPPGAVRLAAELARLAGCEAATLLPSSLHLFWDLFATLATQPLALLVDGASYPIARWGAAAVGAPLQAFPHADAAMAGRLARHWLAAGRCPVILADGYTPGSDTQAPLAAYARIARECEGYLVLDDTQSLGILGSAPCRWTPYGSGGGGSLALHGIAGPEVLMGASLAKGFGAPLAVLCASGALVRRFEERSATRVHCSPPAIAVIEAGLHALRVNRTRGERLRWRLWRAVAQWRASAARHGIALRGGSFPVQTLALEPWIDGERLHACLGDAGVTGVLHRMRHGATVSFLLTALHEPDDVGNAVEILASCLARQGTVSHSRMEVI